MTERTTRQGCTVKTTFETNEAGMLIEHVVLECKGAERLEVVKPDRERNWDWNK
jgi:hypothetical protein